MLLHHTCTLFLYAFSQILNFGHVGILVSTLHDISDICIPLSKAINETHYAKKLAPPTFMVAMLLWAFYRFFLFSQVIYFGTYKTDSLPIDMPHKSAVQYLTYFLCVLIMLHVFWFILFCQMIFILVTKGKVVDATREKRE